MRISGTCFARIRDHHGRYGLLVNQSQLDRGNGRVLSPIGGAFELDVAGKQFLTKLGATDFEQGMDLRCRVPNNQVPAVVEWFRRRIGRETSIMREMLEELVRETGVLVEQDLHDTRSRFDLFFQYEATTPRRDIPERLTTYLIEVFDVRMSPEAQSKLLYHQLLAPEDRWVYFVTKQEILNGVTHDGISIAAISHFVAQA